MTLEQWAYLSTIGQFVLILASVIVISFQLRLGSKLAKAANGQSLAAQACSFNALLIQDADVARIWYSHGRGLDDPTFEGLAATERYRELLVQWLILHEHVFYEKKLLDRDLYDSWDADLKETVNKHALNLVADPISSIFQGEFGKHLLELKNVS